MKLFVGLDVSSQHLDVCFLNGEGDQLWTSKVPNSHSGSTQVKEKILQLTQEISYDRIVIGMEATSHYSNHAALFFDTDKDLKKLQVEVTVENPRTIRSFSGLFTEEKNDRIDAYYIADYLRLERFTTSPLRKEEYMALQRLTRSRFQLINQLTEAKQHFIENLSFKCNTLSIELKNSDLSTTVFSSSIVSLMTEDFSLDDLALLPIEELGELLQTYGKGRFKSPETLAKIIQKSIRDSYRLGKVAQGSIDVILGSLVRTITALKKEIKILDKAIEDLLQILPESQCLESIPGVGKVYAAGILAEIGQIERFDDQKKIARYAGLYWPGSQSGNFKKEHSRMSKSGNEYLRYYLIEATNSVRRYLPEYRDYYTKKYDEVPKFKHKRALALTARKFVRLVDVLLRNHQLYRPPKEVIEG